MQPVTAMYYTMFHDYVERPWMAMWEAERFYGGLGIKPVYLDGIQLDMFKKKLIMGEK